MMIWNFVHLLDPGRCPEYAREPPEIAWYQTPTLKRCPEHRELTGRLTSTTAGAARTAPAVTSAVAVAPAEAATSGRANISMTVTAATVASARTRNVVAFQGSQWPPT